jgi:hypothetical protein
MAQIGSSRPAGSGTSRVSRLLVVLCVAVPAALGIAWLVRQYLRGTPQFTELEIHHVETAPMCPWREPRADLRALFPEATSHRQETRILSANRAELQRRLGRVPTAEENAVYLQRIRSGEKPVGTIVTRRVKGEFGAIELVTGIGEDGRVRGVRIQRQREPEASARVLTSARWLNAFAGKKEASGFQPGAGLPPVPREAEVSARAVADGVRSSVVLVAVANESGLLGEHEGHRH